MAKIPLERPFGGVKCDVRLGPNLLGVTADVDRGLRRRNLFAEMAPRGVPHASWINQVIMGAKE